jgi:hypothetical protein
MRQRDEEEDLFIVWDAYVEGWVDAGGELPF